jgi:hypothetical protein
MSDANTSRFALVAEVTPGTTPATPAFKQLNTTSFDPTPGVERIRSRIVRSDRNIQGSALTGFSAGVQVETELQYDSPTMNGGSAGFAMYDAIKATLQSAAHTAANTEVTNASVLTNVISATGVGTNVEVGDVVRVRTSANALVGYFRVTAQAANSITVEGTISDHAGTDYKVQRGARIKNAATFQSFTAETSNKSPGSSSYDLFELFTYSVFNTMEIAWGVGKATTIKFGLFSKKSDGGSGTRFAGATDVAPPSTSILNPSTHIVTQRVGGVDFVMSEGSLSIDNGAAQRRVCGTQGADSIRTGSFKVNGMHRSYFKSFTEYQKAVNDVASSFLLVQQDGDGHALAIVVPNLKYDNPTRPMQGQDTDIFVTLPWGAEVSATEALSMRILFWD